MLSVSIVLYKHRKDEVISLLKDLDAATSVQRIWLVDNSDCDWASRLSEVPKACYIKSAHNGGYGYGHNLAISAETGECSHHIICNPDISVQPVALDQLYELVRELPQAAFMPNIVYPNGNRQELCKLLPSPLNLFMRRFLPFLASRLDNRYLLREADYSKRFFAPSLSGCFMVCNFQALIALGGFDERYFMYMEDVDLSRRMADLGGTLFLPEVTVVHEFQKASFNNPALFRAHLKSAVQYFNHWGWLFDSQRSRLNSKCMNELPRAGLQNPSSSSFNRP